MLRLQYRGGFHAGPVGGWWWHCCWNHLSYHKWHYSNLFFWNSKLFLRQPPFNRNSRSISNSFSGRSHLQSWITCSMQTRRGKAWEIWSRAMTSGRRRVDTWGAVPNHNNSIFHVDPSLASWVTNGTDAALQTLWPPALGRTLQEGSLKFFVGHPLCVYPLTTWRYRMWPDLPSIYTYYNQPKAGGRTGRGWSRLGIWIQDWAWTEQ